MRLVLAVVLATGCTFGAPGGSASTGDDAPAGPDSGGGDSNEVEPFVPLHVPADGQAPGTADLELTEAVDTGALTIGGSSSLPAGVAFDAWTQPGGGNGVELAVLHVRKLHVPSGVTVRVTGARALVVIASDAIEIDGVLDGSAHRNEPGPGGGRPAEGAGAGRAGSHAGNFRDSGGSGGGFAGVGGRGGSIGNQPGCQTLTGPGGGPSYGDRTLTVLLAGSGGGTVNANGGAAPTCGVHEPGAGGGAIQLSSAMRVRIMGSINAGGGGGGGGRAQQTGDPQCDDSAGAGGGSGGAIFLQAPVVEVPGKLAANGGGGGSGGGDSDGNDQPPEDDGVDGQDGQLSATAAAGGADVGAWSSAGGAGGIVADGGNGGSDNNCDANGGGGGGSAGRIVVALPAGRTASVTGTASPASASTTY